MDKDNLTNSTGGSVTPYRFQITDFISPWGGVSADDIAAELASAQGRPVEVTVSSYGGDLEEALRIYELFRAYEAGVRVRYVGFSASAATILSCGAREITVSPYALVLIHPCSVSVDEWAIMNSDDIASAIRRLYDARDLADKCDRIAAAIYARRTGLEPERVARVMKEAKWLTADEAVALGLADRIDEMADAAAATATGSATADDATLAAALIRWHTASDRLHGAALPRLAAAAHYARRDTKVSALLEKATARASSAYGRATALALAHRHSASPDMKDNNTPTHTSAPAALTAAASHGAPAHDPASGSTTAPGPTAPEPSPAHEASAVTGPLATAAAAERPSAGHPMTGEAASAPCAGADASGAEAQAAPAAGAPDTPCATPRADWINPDPAPDAPQAAAPAATSVKADADGPDADSDEGREAARRPAHEGATPDAAATAAAAPADATAAADAQQQPSEGHDPTWPEAVAALSARVTAVEALSEALDDLKRRLAALEAADGAQSLPAQAAGRAADESDAGPNPTMSAAALFARVRGIG